MRYSEEFVPDARSKCRCKWILFIVTKWKASSLASLATNTGHIVDGVWRCSSGVEAKTCGEGGGGAAEHVHNFCWFVQKRILCILSYGPFCRTKILDVWCTSAQINDVASKTRTLMRICVNSFCVHMYLGSLQWLFEAATSSLSYGEWIGIWVTEQWTYPNEYSRGKHNGTQTSWGAGNSWLLLLLLLLLLYLPL
jgi:hypothetical protein